MHHQEGKSFNLSEIDFFMRLKYAKDIFQNWDDIRLWDVRPGVAKLNSETSEITHLNICSKSEYTKLKNKGFQTEIGKTVMSRVESLGHLFPENSKAKIVLLDLHKRLISEAIWQHYQPKFHICIYKGGFNGLLKEAETLFGQEFKFVQLNGKTGSGKTQTLNYLQENGAQVLDLENLARHKGSAFGNLEGKAQLAQDDFTLSIALQLLKFNIKQPIFVEFEKGSLGKNILPLSLYENFQRSEQVWLELDSERRTKRLVEEYSRINDQSIAAGINKLSFRLGRDKSEKLITALKRKEYVHVASALLDYFDSGESYQKKAENCYNLILENSSPQQTAIELMKKFA